MQAISAASVDGRGGSGSTRPRHGRDPRRAPKAFMRTRRRISIAVALLALVAAWRISSTHEPSRAVDGEVGENVTRAPEAPTVPLESPAGIGEPIAKREIVTDPESSAPREASATFTESS